MAQTTEAQRLAQMESMKGSQVETMAESLLQLTGQDEPESVSAFLSLMIWGARQTGQDEMADLILRMESERGPRETAKAVMGGAKPLDLMSNRGPSEAAEQLLMQMEEALFD